MLEKYYKYKVRYNDYVLLIKIGNFYEIFDVDSLIMNKIFNYKLKPIKDTFKCGFPLSSINNVIGTLDLNKVNYLVIDDDIKINKDFEENNYKNYDLNINILKYNYFRINNIINYLNDNITSDINEKIDLVEEIIFD